MPQLYQCLPEQPRGTCPLLWHLWFCAEPRDLLNCLYVSSKGYRKLGCGRKVVPFFFPGLLLLNPFFPCYYSPLHKASSHPCPIQKQMRGRYWSVLRCDPKLYRGNGRPSPGACTMPVPYSYLRAVPIEPAGSTAQHPAREQDGSILLLKSCSSGLLLHSAHDFQEQ